MVVVVVVEAAAHQVGHIKLLPDLLFHLVPNLNLLRDPRACIRARRRDRPVGVYTFHDLSFSSADCPLLAEVRALWAAFEQPFFPHWLANTNNIQVVARLVAHQAAAEVQAAAQAAAHPLAAHPLGQELGLRTEAADITAVALQLRTRRVADQPEESTRFSSVPDWDLA